MAPAGSCRVVYTLGHSTRGLAEILGLLQGVGSGVLVDVRRWASSKRNPEASGEALREGLSRAGVAYLHLPSLGGYRRFGRDAPVEARGSFDCYESDGFNAYAAYLAASPEAMRGLEVVAYLALSCARPTVMCSERLPWRCHRKVIAEWLALKGFRVVHIIERGRLVEHRPGRCPKLAGKL